MNGGVEQAKVDWEANAPRSVFFDDIYFSGDGLEETRHVFLAGNDLASRFSEAGRFAIGELGFGSGLNILAAWDLWRRTAKPAGARLELLSFEKHPLSAEDLGRTHAALPDIAELSARLIALYPALMRGRRRIALDADVALTLVFDDARDGLRNTDAAIDAWFLDGFAPAKNPDMWSEEIFAEIARLSKQGATASTFTVAGSVRRAMQAAGFNVEKRAGYGRKREMLTARIDTPPTVSSPAPWFHAACASPAAPGAEIAIIGAGVAGTSLAREMRRNGFQPTLVDPHGIAGGASGNPAGLIMPRLDLGAGAGARFFIAAYLEALAAIDAIERESGAGFFNRCGVLLKAVKDETKARLEKITAARLLPDGYMTLRDDGLFFPQAGVIDPARCCALLAAETPLVGARVLSLAAADGKIILRTDDGGERAFAAAVIANGRDALKFRETRTLPLSGVMGQIDHFAAADAPGHAIAFGPYAAPAPEGGLVIGATYEKIAAHETAATSAEATLSNIDALGAALPAIAAALDAKGSSPRASVRCQTPDRLPVVGAMPDWSHYGAEYDDLRVGRKRDYAPAQSVPGLFILSGLGSRGLVTAPLAARMIVAMMAGAPAPVERDISEALHPARFFIRDLKRSQRIVAN
ncbi:MAG: bifunctional tRNA (5-methylaminomethyl-2-thiouridine)(34)-methyltransferase MnmD/FAD-dependent 5-carboxymethylaminomethyl-2-thiouridine(34) oxidoreductase MnmC [Parvularculaceae bacterium]